MFKGLSDLLEAAAQYALVPLIAVAAIGSAKATTTLPGAHRLAMRGETPAVIRVDKSRRSGRGPQTVP